MVDYWTGNLVVSINTAPVVLLLIKPFLAENSECRII